MLVTSQQNSDSCAEHAADVAEWFPEERWAIGEADKRTETLPCGCTSMNCARTSDFFSDLPAAEREFERREAALLGRYE